METFDKITRFLNRMFVLLGGIFLIGMIGLTCANIFLRLVWKPVPGAYELMGYFGALAGAFALGYTQQRRGHIAVDVLIGLMSPGLKRLLSVVNSAVSCGFFVLVAWQVALKARVLMVTGEVTETLRIIYYPFTFAMALGCAVLALVLLNDLVHALFPLRGAER
jgi:TRAP-type C4-dicarboxylate transport system permease small subunit